MSASGDGDAVLLSASPSQTPAAHTATPEKPVPRQRRSDAHSAQVQIQNRRREYLQRHPEYLTSIEHELADPILYERLVKRHQSATEREAEGRAKGYGRTLEADLVRGETKLARLRDDEMAPSLSSSGTQAASHPRPRPKGIDESWDQPAESKAHGLALWQAFLTNRFVQGLDQEFDYAVVDGHDEYDGLARREAEEQWFDDEEPRVDDATRLEGETGVQDF